jgi:hypothetical protein
MSAPTEAEVEALREIWLAHDRIANAVAESVANKAYDSALEVCEPYRLAYEAAIDALAKATT